MTALVSVSWWLAQVPTFTPTDDPTGVLGVYWPALAPLLPVLVALATRCDASPQVKQGLAAVFALGAAVVSVLGYDWAGVTVGVVLLRAGAIFAAAQATFFAADGALTSWFGRRFNNLAVFLPGRGVTGREPTTAPTPADGGDPVDDDEPSCLADINGPDVATTGEHPVLVER